MVVLGKHLCQEITFTLKNVSYFQWIFNPNSPHMWQKKLEKFKIQSIETALLKLFAILSK